jgi:NitT/TauT family transport system ATP-binding protein
MMDNRAGQSPAGEAAKIRIRDLKKSFDTGLVAIGGISVDIADGEFFVIVGPSGCGKTTLLRIAAGLDTPTSGTIDIARSDVGQPANAMVFQGDSLFPWYSVYDNAAYGLQMRHTRKSAIDATVRPLLEAVGLWQFRDFYPSQLSGGMRQRVSIVRAFANEPEVLLMDEPFSALDEQNRLILHEELLRIWEQTRKTVMFITHSVDEAVTLGDRIMVMTAQPGHAKAIMDVNFPRPRSVLELRNDPAYGSLVFSIWSHLRSEVRTARAIEHERPGA